MKKSLIIILACGLALSACKKDKLQTVSSTITPPQLTTPADGTSIVVTTADSTQNLNIVWKPADYGVQAVITSSIQIALAGTNFAKKAVVGNTSGDTVKLTYGSLNNILLSNLLLPGNAVSTVEIRVVSNIYGKDTVFSKSTKLNVTTLQLAPLKLSLPGSYESNSLANAPTIPKLTGFTYEGYAYFNAPGTFKFEAPDGSRTFGYGNKVDSLTTSSNATAINYGAAGYYKLNADISKLSYSAVLIQSFGLIGTATVGQWDNSTPMTFDQGRGVWTITTALLPGALKFRANNAWDINYGPADSNALTGTLIQTNDAVNINVAGTYTVTIDMSQSSQTKYVYSVVKN